MSWRNLDGEYLAGLRGLAEEQHPDRFTLYPVHKLSNLLYEHVKEFPNVSVRFSHQVVRVGQDVNKAWVEAKTGDRTEKFEGDFVVGCDGASSGVRKAIYGEEFPGFSWPRQLIATNVRLLKNAEKRDAIDDQAGKNRHRQVQVVRRPVGRASGALGCCRQVGGQWS